MGFIMGQNANLDKKWLFSEENLESLVNRLGLEPRTIRLKVECSTN